MARVVEKDSDWIAAALRERRSLLERTTETYLTPGDRLDDEIAALEAAQRLSAFAEGGDFGELLDQAERNADQT